MPFIIRAVAVMLFLSPARLWADENKYDLHTTAEFKVLARFVGEWTQHVTIQIPEAKEGETTGIYSWTLEGRFLEMKGHSNFDNSDSRQFVTYDSRQKSYRGWWFNSSGFVLSASATWDEATKTLTWTCEEDDTIGITKDRFIDDDTREWSSTTKNRRGEVVFQIRGRAERKKR